MRNIYFYTALCIVFFAFTTKHSSNTSLFKLPKGVTEKDYIPNTLVIKFKKNILSNLKSRSAEQKIRLSSELEISLKQIFPTSAYNTTSSKILGQKNEDDLSLYFRATFSGNKPIESVINLVLKDETIAYAEPAYIYSTFDTPNDASYNLQYALPLVKAPQAWDIIKNSSNVIIGIVDTGSELNHPDLAANIYLNAADPVDGIDNDGNGYIDDYQGWDLGGASINSMIADNNPNVTNGAGDHGIHVSGIAAAVSGNGIGVASLAQNAKLLIVKASADDTPTSIPFGYEGIKYAVDRGAHIVNCSWGGEGRSQFGQDIINYATSRGVLVIAAAGNDGNNIPIYPAAYDGVLAVGNTNATDKKANGSNYGSYLDIFAPGEGIYSTGFGGTYTYKSGTSMAAPMVASAAALVKAKNPSYTGEQIAEVLRNTADNIDAVNPNFAGSLGKGRLNVYRSLTELPVAVRYESVAIKDLGFGNRAAGTEIVLDFDIKNFLAPVFGLKATLSTASEYVSILTGVQQVGDFTSLQQKDNAASFSIKIRHNVPDNYLLRLKVSYEGNGGAYLEDEVYEMVIGLDYINFSVNQIATTLTSVGRIGYSKGNAEGGMGFVYKSDNLLYEAAFMIAQSETKVMNNARSSNSSSEDFRKGVVANIVKNEPASFEGTAEFSDGGSTSPIGLNVRSKMLAFNTIGDEKYAIATYEITNKSATDLSGIYTGLFTDWDIDNSSANATEFDATTNTAVAYATNNGAGPYVGVRLLNLKASPAYYPMSYYIVNDFLSDNNFTTAEKFRSLSSGIHSTGVGHDGGTGYDVMFTIGSGPYEIAKQSTISVAYAIMASDRKEDLKVIGDRAQVKYDLFLAANKPPTRYVLGQNYPNHAKAYTYVPIEIPEDSEILINIYDVIGRKIKTINFGELRLGKHQLHLSLTGFKPGMYTYQMVAPKFKQAKKMLIAQ